MALASFKESSITSGDDAKKNADKRRFENDLISMEADESRFLKKVEAMELDLRILQKNYTALGFEIKDKHEEMQKSQSSLQFLEEEIRVLKKKINNL